MTLTKESYHFNMNFQDFIKNKSASMGINVINILKADDYRAQLNIKKITPARQSLFDFFPATKVIISAALSYDYSWNRISSATDGYIARYTSANYYKLLFKKLKKLAVMIKSQAAPDMRQQDFFRISINSKLDDKMIARLASTGTFGKNSLIISPQYGCRIVLGTLLLDMDSSNIITEQNHLPDDICGSCKKCIKACPTGALTPGHVNKSICLQHLASEKDWPQKIGERDMIELWGTRFFGCTDCIDSCSFSKKTPPQDDIKPLEIPGYIGTTFDVKKILNLSKNNYKELFQSNQLAASWIEPVVLARNALVSLYHQHQKAIIKAYVKKLGILGWEEDEVIYLKNFINLLK